MTPGAIYSLRMGIWGMANSGTTTMGKGGEALEESVPDGLLDLCVVAGISIGNMCWPLGWC